MINLIKTPLGSQTIGRHLNYYLQAGVAKTKQKKEKK